MKSKFDLAQWALVNLPMALAALAFAGGLGYLLKHMWTENVALRAARDGLAVAHALELKELHCAHQALLQAKTDEIKALVDRYHAMAERNIVVLDSLDHTIDRASALPLLAAELPAIRAALLSIGAKAGLLPHELR